MVELKEAEQKSLKESERLEIEIADVQDLKHIGIDGRHNFTFYILSTAGYRIRICIQIICSECVLSWIFSASSVFCYLHKFGTACWHNISCITRYNHMHTHTAHQLDDDPICESARPKMRLYSHGFLGSPRELVSTAGSRGHRVTPAGTDLDVTGRIPKQIIK
ncbi:hypothetical protein LXL04_034628 [Taraxacum kok-saghyz]